MPLFDYECENCRYQFESLTRSSEVSGSEQTVACPKCSQPNPKKLISRFRVGGRGDLRESTQDGCHDCQMPSHHED